MKLEGNSEMVAYEFYCQDEIKGFQLIGILPERRKSSERITKESIMNWGKNVIGDNIDANEIFFIQVTIKKDTGQVIESNPFLKIKNQLKRNSIIKNI